MLLFRGISDVFYRNAQDEALMLYDTYDMANCSLLAFLRCCPMSLSLSSRLESCLQSTFDQQRHGDSIINSGARREDGPPKKGSEPHRCCQEVEIKLLLGILQRACMADIGCKRCLFRIAVTQVFQSFTSAHMLHPARSDTSTILQVGGSESNTVVVSVRLCVVIGRHSLTPRSSV